MFGVYTLANDKVFSKFSGLVGSFRHHNPKLPIAVIPFSEPCRLVKEHCDQLGIPLLEGDFSRYDRIGRNCRATRHGPGIFRKYFVFDGPYEQSLFIDADCTVLDDLEPFSKVLDEHDLDLAYYGGPGPNRNLIAPEIKALSTLMGKSPEGINDAFFLSRRDALSSEFLLTLSRNAKRLKELVVGPANEQALLSYACAVSGIRFAKLETVAEELAPRWHKNRRIVKRGEHFKFQNDTRRLRVFHWGNVKWKSGLNAWIVDDHAAQEHRPAGG